MMAQRPYTSDAAKSFGLPYKVFHVEEVSAATATGTDQFGRQMTIPLITRAKARLPAAGDRWLIDQTLGAWGFSAYIDGPIPTIAGSRGTGDTADRLEDLLQALQAAGILLDRTEGGP